jgi:hypothetical protein
MVQREVEFIETGREARHGAMLPTPRTQLLCVSKGCRAIVVDPHKRDWRNSDCVQWGSCDCGMTTEMDDVNQDDAQGGV